jgi:hypothetical protein
MKTSIKYSFIIIALFLQGCRGCKTTTVAPATGLTSYCTTTEQIYNLKKDMSVNDVNTILGVPPTDIYINQKDGTKIISYKYKLKYQKVASGQQDSEMSLRGGEEMFRDEANLFVIFDANSNKLLYYVTDKGRKEAKDLIGKSIELKYSNQ